jgi:hypothetical protein
MMRTTVTLPDDVYEIARSLAAQRGISLGDALAELARRGLKPPPPPPSKKAFPSFHVPVTARPITLEQTLEAEDEL